MNKCEYCEKLFSTKSNLSYHQKTAKYCLEKRETEYKEYKCDCEKNFTTKINYDRHKKICNINYIINPYKEENIKLENQNKIYIKNIEDKDKQLENQNKIYLKQLEDKDKQLENQNKIYLKQLEDKDKHIRELEAQLASIALAGVNKSTTTNNNVSNINNKILNISPLDLNDAEKFKTILDSKFDTNYILDGQKGLAHFAKDHFLKDDDGKLKYVCTDPGRQTFKYKDELGDIQKDVKAKKLTKILIDAGLKEKNNTVAVDWWTSDEGKINNDKFTILQPKASEIHNMSEVENTLFVNELSAITTL
jgi:hypothetical protein